MYVVEVIPFARGSQLEALTYYASDSYAPGTIVTIPVRKRELRGMVTSIRPLSAAKTAVRAATFSLRRLPEQENAVTLPPTLIAAATKLTETNPTTVGAALYALLPPEVRDGTHSLLADHKPTTSNELPLVSVLQATGEERYRAYRSRIREAFAHRGSVLFVVPTTADVERAYAALTQGITERAIVFSPAFSPKKTTRAYEAFHDLAHAKLIITTPKHAFIDRHDITLTIIEQSRSPYYKSRVRPYFDMREVLRTMARTTGREVLLGDILPNTEDEYHRRTDRYLTESEHPKRILFPNAFKIITQNDAPTGESPFTLFSKQLNEAIARSIRERKHTFLLAARRGLAPVVACADCGHIFRCPDSGRPYSLMRTMKGDVEERWFLSTTSGKRVRAVDSCPSCSSWRLRERGIGIQHIADELAKEHPDAKVVLFDHTTATTFKKAQRLMTDFYDTKGAILLATPMVLPYLEQPVEHTAVVSLDATRSIPSWRADEELFALLLALREQTRGIVFVQTRSETDTLLEYATRGAVDHFYTDEIELRDALGYPPFTTLVHLTFSAPVVDLMQLEGLITAQLAPTTVSYYSTAAPAGGMATRYGLIRIPQHAWPDPALMDRLRTLPPSVRIEVNPPKIV